MDVVIEQYFDFSLMFDNFDRLMEGFWETIQLSIFAGILSLVLGLFLALLRQLPGRALAPVRWATIAYIDAFRGIPVLLVILLISGSLGAFAVEGVLPRELGNPATGSASPTTSGTGSSRSPSATAPTWPRSTAPGSRRFRAARWRLPARWE